MNFLRSFRSKIAAAVVLLAVLPAAVFAPAARAESPTVPAAAKDMVASGEAAAHEAGGHDSKATEGEVLSPAQKGAVTGITTLVVFLILLAILTKVAFGPIAAGLKKREDKIRDDIQNAEKAHAAAAQKLKEYEARLASAEADARKITSEATATAQKIAASLTEKAQKDIEELRAKASREIESEKNAAITEIKDQAVYLSTSIAEKILKRSLNADDQRDLVRSSLEQLGSANKN